MNDTEQRIIDSKIAAKDIAQELERVMLRASQILIRDRHSWEIHVESPELFAVQLVLSRTALAAGRAREQLLRAIGMPVGTRFAHPLSHSIKQHSGS